MSHALEAGIDSVELRAHSAGTKKAGLTPGFLSHQGVKSPAASRTDLGGGLDCQTWSQALGRV